MDSNQIHFDGNILNDTSSNGTQLDDVKLDSTELGGIQLDGDHLKGTRLNDTPFDWSRLDLLNLTQLEELDRTQFDEDRSEAEFHGTEPKVIIVQDTKIYLKIL